MNRITAIIIDDEVQNRSVLNTLLKSHCPLIEVIAEAGSAMEAFELINRKSPQMIFLDIKMPKLGGFDLLKMFKEIDFEVIFVSAFNEYAVTAFEFNALGYILKPIDYSKLVPAVNKAVLKIGLKGQGSNVVQFIKTLETKTDMISKLPMQHNEKVVLVNISEIVSIKANEGVCRLEMINKEHYHSTKDLKLFEGILKELDGFVRISKNVIINLGFLKSYRKGDTCVLEMVDGSEFEVSRRKKTDVLSRIRLL